MKQPLFRFMTTLLVLGALAACQPETQQVTGPIAITRDTHCSLDGMTLADYPGPKAQIQYAQGDPDFFCDTVEMFAIYLQPEEQRVVTAMYVHDMDKNDWNTPGDQWIEAQQAYYVVGSKRLGSMGPTFVSFGTEAGAQAFMQQEGGKVLRFGEVTPGMAVLDGGVLKDRHM